jgi:hypothetical protein
MEEQVFITPRPGYATSARHWARILERLFPLPRLGTSPELTLLPSADEVAVIDRFIIRALRLAESEGLNGASGVRTRSPARASSPIPTRDRRIIRSEDRAVSLAAGSLALKGAGSLRCKPLGIAATPSRVVGLGHPGARRPLAGR